MAHSPRYLFLLTELMALIFAMESTSQHSLVFMLLSSSELSGFASNHSL